MKISHLLDIFTKPTIILKKQRDGPWSIRLVETNRILGFRLKRIGPEFKTASEAVSFYQQIVEDKDELPTANE